MGAVPFLPNLSLEPTRGSASTLGLMKTARIVIAFVALLFAADFASSLATSWLAPWRISVLPNGVKESAGPELVEAVCHGAAFLFAGIALAALAPKPFARSPVSAGLLGLLYSAALYLFLPFLPAARDTLSPWWLFAIACAPYYLPAVASTAGAFVFKAWRGRVCPGLTS